MLFHDGPYAAGDRVAMQRGQFAGRTGTVLAVRGGKLYVQFDGPELPQPVTVPADDTAGIIDGVL